MSNEKKFRSLTGKEAKVKFATTLLYCMTSNDTLKIDAIFDEARVGNILKPKRLEELAKKAKKIIPVKLVYKDNEKEDMQRFINYRDEILKACGCYK